MESKTGFPVLDNCAYSFCSSSSLGAGIVTVFHCLTGDPVALSVEGTLICFWPCSGLVKAKSREEMYLWWFACVSCLLQQWTKWQLYASRPLLILPCMCSVHKPLDHLVWLPPTLVQAWLKSFVSGEPEQWSSTCAGKTVSQWLIHCPPNHLQKSCKRPGFCRPSTTRQYRHLGTRWDSWRHRHIPRRATLASPMKVLVAS